MPDPVQGKGKMQEELLSALCGRQAERERQTTEQVRRSVCSSCRLLNALGEGKRRRRAAALAAVLVAVMLLGPLFGSAIYTFFEEEMLSGQFGQLSLGVIFLLAAVAAAAAVAGWLRRRP